MAHRVQHRTSIKPIWDQIVVFVKACLQKQNNVAFVTKIVFHNQNHTLNTEAENSEKNTCNSSITTAQRQA